MFLLHFLCFLTFSFIFCRSEICTQDNCQLPSCQCSISNDNPTSLDIIDLPQFILLTFVGSLNKDTLDSIQSILKSSHRNPNKCPITSTFFIHNIDTEYCLVQHLFDNQNEIAITISDKKCSLTKCYNESHWTNDDWYEEIKQQRTNIVEHTQIHQSHIKGFHAPHIKIDQNKYFEFLHQFHFHYDSSMLFKSSSLMYPFTLDYLFDQTDCINCQQWTKPFEAFWQFPLHEWTYPNATISCRTFFDSSCLPINQSHTVDLLFDFIMHNFERHSSIFVGYRSPFIIQLDLSWLSQHKNLHLQALIRFIKYILNSSNHRYVYFVSIEKVLEWFKYPRSLDELHDFWAFSCNDKIYENDIDCFDKELNENEKDNIFNRENIKLLKSNNRTNGSHSENVNHQTERLFPNAKDGKSVDILSIMNRRTVHLLDLSDEILLIILKKLGSMDVLYSLLGVNRRLDQMARSFDKIKFMKLSFISNGQFSSIDDVKLNRFCYEILPQINHKIVGLSLALHSMERILLACRYPHLTIIVITIYPPNRLVRYLTEGSPIARLFREQIRSITVMTTNEVFTNESFTDTCERILAICINLFRLNMNRWIKGDSAQLSLRHRSPNICCSSYLHTLSINVKSFDDCLCLLDGRLYQLSSFAVNINSIKRSPIITDSQKVLSNLKEFSLTSIMHTNAYDCRILLLLRRMPNLNKLTLCLNIMRLIVIDGIHLDEEILSHMLYLNTFIFHICTIMSTSETNYFLSINDIKNTFHNWKYSPVNCCIDHFSNGFTYYNIYSIPFKMTRFMHLTNSFRGYHFQFITYLTLYDTRPFEYDFFEWISQSFPLLEYLLVHNSVPQENKGQIESINNKKPSSNISYLYLTQLRLSYAHIDYVDQFLCHTNTYIPRLKSLGIQYEKLVTVTNNFTNDATRLNCSQLKQIIFDELLVYPKHFYLYFPSLIK
ncbi:unnamed protein product [Rotaria sordida]|uniref:F-box domain-containing protein n=1 Tax=Rotaria sordida TaxID=392033 RepID=A0A814P6E2_9BILA|nr:unnamed protein product [Rotaria sordida]